MPINNLVPQYRSPVATYASLRQMKGQEATNSMNMLATGQKMNIAQQAETREQRLQKVKSLAAVGQYLDQFPEEQKASEFENVKSSMDQFGLPAVPAEVTYDQVKSSIDQSKLMVYGQEKGTRRNMLVNNQVVPGIERETGQVFSPSGRPMPGATIAPTRQETGEAFAYTDIEGKSARDKDKVKATDEATNLYSLSGNVEKIKQAIASADDYVGGVSGSIVNTVNSMRAQVQQVYGGKDPVMTDGRIDPNKLKTGSGKLNKQNIDWLRSAAMSNSAVDSATLELAFLHAKVLNNSGKISDADVRFAREIVEGGADKAIKQQKLDQLIDRAHINYQANRKAREGTQRHEYWKDITLDELRPTSTIKPDIQREAESMADELLKGL